MFYKISCLNLNITLIMKNTLIAPNTEPATTFTELDLSHKVINRILSLLNTLKTVPTTATSINFSDNKISFEVFSIVDALKGTSVKIVNFANNDIADRAPGIVRDLKDTGVIAVNLSGNNTTFLVDLECLYNALTGGHIRKLGLTYKAQCASLLEEAYSEFISLIHEEFKGQGYDESLACPVDLVFPKGIEMLIGEYIVPSIELDW